MAIDILGNCINIGGCTICDVPAGFSFNGVITAKEGFCDVRVFQGSVSGYTSGGTGPPNEAIDKFPFTSDANAIDVGELGGNEDYPSGQSSETNGYASGASNIRKFPFASDTPATDVAEINPHPSNGCGAGGNSSKLNDGGFISGGSGPGNNIVFCFPFSADAPAADVGELNYNRCRLAGQDSTTHGYLSGGIAGPAKSDVIEKFPHSASFGSSSDIGNLTTCREGVSGQSSETHGYTSGGEEVPGFATTIDKFPFSTDTNASDVGELSQARAGIAGQSSTNSGYASGGATPPRVTTIDKFPFSSDTSATDIGDMTVNRSRASGQQV